LPQILQKRLVDLLGVTHLPESIFLLNRIEISSKITSKARTFSFAYGSFVFFSAQLAL